VAKHSHGAFWRGSLLLAAALWLTFAPTALSAFPLRMEVPQAVESEVDPVLHKYLYANANPIHWWDPSGHIGVSNFIYGTIVHEYIGADFERSGFGTYDLPIGALVGNPTSIFASYRPDLVTPATGLTPGQVYEIKPILTGQLAAATQLGFYLVALHSADLQSPKRLWIPGTSYNPPTVIPIKAGTVAFARRTAPGVIIYEVVDATEIAAIASAYAIARIQMDLSFALTLSLRGIN